MRKCYGWYGRYDVVANRCPLDNFVTPPVKQCDQCYSFSDANNRSFCYQIECPYCGSDQRSSFHKRSIELYFGVPPMSKYLTPYPQDNEELKHECTNCFKKFYVESEVEIEFRTSKIREEEKSK